MTSATVLQFAEYTGKKVVVTHNTTDKDGAPVTEELEGKVEVGNDTGLLVKPKGKTSLVLIEAANVELVELAPDDTALKAKKIKPVKLGQARSHLLERHGVSLSEVNGLTEQEAYDAHLRIDHVQADLGHFHGEKDAPAEAQPSTE